MVCPNNKNLLKQVFTFNGNYSFHNVFRVVSNVLLSPIGFPMITLPRLCYNSRKYKKYKAEMQIQLQSEFEFDSELEFEYEYELNQTSEC